MNEKWIKQFNDPKECIPRIERFQQLIKEQESTGISGSSLVHITLALVESVTTGHLNNVDEKTAFLLDIEKYLKKDEYQFEYYKALWKYVAYIRSKAKNKSIKLDNSTTLRSVVMLGSGGWMNSLSLFTSELTNAIKLKIKGDDPLTIYETLDSMGLRRFYQLFRAQTILNTSAIYELIEKISATFSLAIDYNKYSLSKSEYLKNDLALLLLCCSTISVKKNDILCLKVIYKTMQNVIPKSDKVMQMILYCIRGCFKLLHMKEKDSNFNEQFEIILQMSRYISHIVKSLDEVTVDKDMYSVYTLAIYQCLLLISEKKLTEKQLDQLLELVNILSKPNLWEGKLYLTFAKINETVLGKWITFLTESKTPERHKLLLDMVLNYMLWSYTECVSTNLKAAFEYLKQTINIMSRNKELREKYKVKIINIIDVFVLKFGTLIEIDKNIHTFHQIIRCKYDLTDKCTKESSYFLYLMLFLVCQPSFVSPNKDAYLDNLMASICSSVASHLDNIFLLDDVIAANNFPFKVEYENIDVDMLRERQLKYLALQNDKKYHSLKNLAVIDGTKHCKSLENLFLIIGCMDNGITDEALHMIDEKIKSFEVTKSKTELYKITVIFFDASLDYINYSRRLSNEEIFDIDKFDMEKGYQLNVPALSIEKECFKLLETSIRRYNEIFKVLENAEDMRKVLIIKTICERITITALLLEEMGIDDCTFDSWQLLDKYLIYEKSETHILQLLYFRIRNYTKLTIEEQKLTDEKIKNILNLKLSQICENTLVHLLYYFCQKRELIKSKLILIHLKQLFMKSKSFPRVLVYWKAIMLLSDHIRYHRVSKLYYHLIHHRLQKLILETRYDHYLSVIECIALTRGAIKLHVPLSKGYEYIRNLLSLTIKRLMRLGIVKQSYELCHYLGLVEGLNEKHNSVKNIILLLDSYSGRKVEKSSQVLPQPNNLLSFSIESIQTLGSLSETTLKESNVTNGKISDWLTDSVNRSRNRTESSVVECECSYCTQLLKIDHIGMVNIMNAGLAYFDKSYEMARTLLEQMWELRYPVKIKNQTIEFGILVFYLHCVYYTFKEYFKIEKTIRQLKLVNQDSENWETVYIELRYRNLRPQIREIEIIPASPNVEQIYNSVYRKSHAKKNIHRVKQLDGIPKRLFQSSHESMGSDPPISIESSGDELNNAVLISDSIIDDSLIADKTNTKPLEETFSHLNISEDKRKAKKVSKNMLLKIFGESTTKAESVPMRTVDKKTPPKAKKPKETISKENIINSRQRITRAQAKKLNN